MADFESKQSQVDANYEIFEKRLSELMLSHAGKFALMHDGEIIEFFDTANDADLTGSHLYTDGLFSVQLVDSAPVDLGFWSRMTG